MFVQLSHPRIEQIRRILTLQPSTFLSIRFLLILAIVLPIMGTGALVSWLGLGNSQRSVQVLATKLTQEMSKQIAHHLEDKLMIPQKLNQLNQEAIQLQALDLDNLEQMGRFFQKQAQLFEVCRINFVNQAGEFVGVERSQKGEIRLQQNTTKALTKYDPRRESWYQKAVQTRQPQWSSIYQGQKPEGGLVIASSYPLYNSRGQLTGVLGVDLTLNQLQEFLQKVKATPSSRAFIIEAGGLIVSSSSHEANYQILEGRLVRLLAQQSSDVVVRESSQHLIRQFNNLKVAKEQTLVLEIAKQKYFLKITPWQERTGLDWLIVVAIPESDFMLQVHEDSQTTIVLSILAVLAALSLAMGMARWLAIPLLKLNEISKAVAQGKFPSRRSLGSYFAWMPRIKELEELSHSFNRVSKQLQVAIRELEENNINLEQQVEERTFELKASQEKFSKLFWYSPIGMAIVDPADNRLLEANEILLQIIGYTKEEAINKVCIEFKDLDLLASPSLKNHECFVKNQAREWINIELSLETINLQEQQRFLLAVQDISARKQAESEHHARHYTLTALVENCTSLILLATVTGKITYINLAGRQLIGLGEAVDLETLSLKDFCFSPEPNYYNECLEKLHQGQSWQKEVQLRHFQEDRPIPVLCNAFPIKDKATGQILGIGVYMNDLQDHKEAQAALKLSEEKHRRIVETANEGIWLIDAAGKTRYVNPRMAKMLGYQPEEMLNKSLFDFLDDEEITFWQPSILAGCEQRKETPLSNHLEQYDFKFRRQDGAELWAIISKTTIFDAQGNYQGALGMITDITERKQAEVALQNSIEELRLSEEQLQLALEASNEGLWDWNIPTSKVYYSPRWLAMLGYEVGDLPGCLDSWEQLLHPEDRNKVIYQLQAYLQGKTPLYHLEYRLRTKLGEWKWIINYGKVVVRDKQGKPLRMIGTHKDITLAKQRQAERQKAQVQLKNSLEEKEMLLREIHHRVKNNLHVVANLLDLQSDYVAEPRVISLFADSQSRIQSMALIHEQLYQSENLREVNFGDYIHRLVHNLFSSHEVKGNIESVVEVEPVLLNLETAIPCGLLINELLTNVFKHAFPQGRQGRVRVQLSQDEQGFLHLRIADNGRGLPSGLDWQQSPTLGLKLVRILCQQLKAQVSLDTGQGTDLTLVFKQLNYQPRF